MKNKIPEIKYSKGCLEYETRCRRCNSFVMWHYGTKESHEIDQFHTYMLSCLQYPRIYHCKECKIDTVQDITAYNLHQNK